MDKTKTGLSMDEAIRSLIEGAYVLSPLYPGNWKDYEEVSKKFHELYASRFETPCSNDFGDLLQTHFPEATVKDDVTPKGYDQAIKALRINADKLVKIQSLTKKLDRAFNNKKVEVHAHGWKSLSEVGSPELIDECLAVGMAGLRQAFDVLRKNKYEFAGDFAIRLAVADEPQAVETPAKPVEAEATAPADAEVAAPIEDEAVEAETVEIVPAEAPQGEDSENKSDLYSLVMEAYKQAPWHGCKWRNSEDVANNFYAIAAERLGADAPQDFEAVAASVIAPDKLKYYDDFKSKGEVFKAIKILTAEAEAAPAPAPAPVTVENIDDKVLVFRDKLVSAYQKSDFLTGDYSQWKKLEQVAGWLSKEDWQAVGCEKIKMAIERYCQGLFELLALDQKGLPPMVIRQVAPAASVAEPANEAQPQAQADDKLRGMLEVAYATSPTQKGLYRKCDDLRDTFAQLYAERCGAPFEGDFDELISTTYPTAKTIDYKAEEAEETFKAIKIPNDQLTISGKLKYLINTAFNNSPASPKLPEGWKFFASVSSTVSKDLKECSAALGFKNPKEAIETICSSHYEFGSQDDKATIIRQIKPVSTNPPTNVNNGGETPRKYEPSIGKALGEFAYFRANSPEQSGWASALDALAAKAIKENWYIRKKDEPYKPVLSNYLSYTFERLEYETKNNKNKIVKTADVAIFNTGLVDSCYEPIYAVFKKNNIPDRQPWIFYNFVTKNDGDQIINQFPSLPEPAEYYTDRAELLYDITAGKPTFNMKHIFCDNVNRLPLKFIRNGAPNNYPFKDKNEIFAMSPDARKAYYEKLGQDIMANDTWKRKLSSLFDMAITQAVNRVKWNYKNAIPVYYFLDKCLSICLPLDLDDNGRYDISLVCKHHYGETADGQKYNNYEGRTIFTPDMVCNNARLIVRPNSDWFPASE